MSTTLDSKRKSPIGLERLVVWQMTADEDTGITYEETATEISKTLMTASDTPSFSQAEQSADNQVVDEVSAKTGGQLTLGLTNLNSEDRVLIYGEKADNETNITNKDDVVPYLCVAFMTTRSDGKVNLYKYPKIKFVEQAENFETIKRDGITFATSSMQGNYIPTVANGDARYVRRGLDRKTDAAAIASWFTEADYYKPETV